MAKTMNKSEFVESVAKKLGGSKKSAMEAVDAVLDGIKGSMAKGSGVAFAGFGTFTTSKRKARKGRNPRTGKPIAIPARTVPVFRSGKALKQAVR